MSVDGDDVREAVDEDDVQAVEEPDNRFLAALKRAWGHIWFLLLLSIFAGIVAGAFALVWYGYIDFDVDVSATVDVGQHISLFLYLVLAALALYTWKKYVLLAGEEHAEGVVSKVTRGIAVVMDNYEMRDGETGEQTNDDDD